MFRASRNSDVSAVAHLRGYADISESTNFDLGFSYARGHNELGSEFLTTSMASMPHSDGNRCGAPSIILSSSEPS